jgi:hypothetical protein
MRTAFVWLVVCLGSCASPALSAPANDPLLRSIALSELEPAVARQDWGGLQIDRSVYNRPLQIGDRSFATGLGTHANSELVYELDSGGERFEAWVGVDAAMRSYTNASVVFQVFADGRPLFDSGVMRVETPARRVSVPLAGARVLKLVVTDAGDGKNCDHADWAEAVLIAKAQPPETLKPARYKVLSPTIQLELTEDGEIAGVKAGGFARPWRGWTRLSGCAMQGSATVSQLPEGGLLFSRRLKDERGHACTVVDRFAPAQDSIRWEVEIAGEGESWSTAVVTALACAEPEGLRFWTGWSDPEHRGDVWRDPLALIPLARRGWHYGNAAQTAPVGGDFISLPLLTLASPAQEGAFSLVLSPDDVLLNLRLSASSHGDLRFTRTCHRLGGGRAVRFAMNLVGHEADWRGGLRWLVDRYPAFFEPPNPRVDELAGCGAYSGDERPIDVAKFTRMAFRINWKMSDDFPYMGMFIPPVKDADERWTRSCDEPKPTGKADTISCRQMNDYARYMKDHGFHVLNYFNVTEFGKNMADKTVPPSRASDPDLWKDPVAFIKLRLPGAYFKPPIDTCYHAWVTDVGDPDYRRFLLEQARHHLELLPDTDGFCIDRMDWLRYYNPHADDGVSWVDGKPARSLYQSWHGFMAELGPLVHRADKVIFANTMTMRLELNRHLDGIYTEHGDNPGALNAAALMGMRKPVLAWTYNETLNQPDPDSFFQRHLHLGVYPTAPYPFNHHCINPEPKADRFYLDYGPLLDALRGRKWVLTARCVEASTPGVKVNLFQVPAGYVIPVTFGGKNEAAHVRLHNLAGLDRLKAEALYPGVEKPAALPAKFTDGRLELDVPLQRGCALVRLSEP